jgi:SAM-dependent methyltransferase
MPDPAALTAADIARLAGVTRATVSNWRRRHPDFPEPSGGTDASPAYDRAEVEAWLADRGTLPEPPLGERLWRQVLEMSEDANLGDVVVWAARALSATSASGEASDKGIPEYIVGCDRVRASHLAQELSDAAGKCSPLVTLDLLIGKYAEASGGRISVTPRPVADLMSALAGPVGGAVFDPACGTGELLAAAARHGALRLLGQELDAGLAELAAIRLAMLTGQGKADVAGGDSLRADRFGSEQADVVLCHPPFGDRDWGQEELADDPRWEYGLPPKSEPELAWVQHALAHLRPGGRALLLLPPAVAARPSGRRVRAELLRRGAVRAVIALTPGVIYPRNVGPHLWVLERPPEERPREPWLLLVNGAAPDEILDAWNAFTADHEAAGGEPGEWRVVPAIDLLDESVDLTPARHVGTRRQAGSSAEVALAVRAGHDRLRAAIAALGGMPGGDWTPRVPESGWREVSIGDLARSGAVVAYRASAASPAGDEPTSGKDGPDAWPVLTVADVVRGEPASGAAPGGRAEPGWTVISSGDVVLPAAVTDRAAARVAGEADEDAVLGRGLHLIRPDPRRVDSWFLAGFLTGPANIQQASYGTSVTRVDVRRLIVPLLPLPVQREYGVAFRRLHEYAVATRDFAARSADLTELLSTSLADGVLLPGDGVQW